MRLFNGVLLFVLSLVVSVHGVERPRQSTEPIVEGFIKALQADKNLDAAAVKEAVKLIDELKVDSEGRAIAIAEALRIVHADFRNALVLLGEENFAEAAAKLRPLTQQKDLYVAAEAAYFLARSMILEERFEEALPLLADLREKFVDHSVRGGESLFLTGVAAGQLLQRDEAIKSLSEFVEKFPDAPERMRVGAFRQLEILKLIQEGTLSDVHLRMEFSRRRLTLEDSGKNTREQQDKIIDLLAKLIKEAEDKESQGKGSGKGQQQKGQGKAGESESQAQGDGKGEGQQGGQSGGGSKGTDSDSAKKLHRGGPQSPWSKLRDRDRDPVFNALKEKFPGRYQELIEQYYKSFQDEDEG